jgi:hypothetical protein
MAQAGFESEILTSERPQSLALDSWLLEYAKVIIKRSNIRVSHTTNFY